LWLTLSLPGLGFLAGALGAEALPGLGSLVVPVTVIFFLVLLNGLYVAAEFAVIGVRPTQVEQLVAAGNRTARHVLSTLRSPRQQDRYIATAQLGITIASLGLGMYGEPQLAHFVEPYVAHLIGVDLQAAVVRTTGYVMALSLLTYLHIVIGEMIPKSLALSAPGRTVLTVTQPMRLSQAFFALPVRLLNGIGVALLRLFRIPPASGRAQLYSPDELEFIVAESAGVGLLSRSEVALVRNIFDFGDLHVHQVMTPRLKVQAIPHDAPLPEVLATVMENPHSRFPVYEGSPDNIIGMLHVKDLARQQMRTKGNFDLRLLLRPAPLVPEHYPVEKLLAVFKRQRSQLAVVLDEFGGTAGIVTLEDIVEEVVGEVRDEFDKSAPAIQNLPDGSVLIDGLTLIEDVNDYFGLSLRDEHYDTIAGFVLGRLGRMAKVGDSVEIDGLRLKVEALDGLRIARLSLTPLNPQARDGARGEHHR
jgi:CBS domain containing-hemolysin-like protein